MKESAPKQVSAKVLTAASSLGASQVEQMPQVERTVPRVRLALPQDEPMDKPEDTTQQPAATGAISNDFRVSSFSRGVISSGIAGLDEQGSCDLHPMEA